MALHAALEPQLTAERPDARMQAPMDEGEHNAADRGPGDPGIDSGAHHF